MARKNKPDHGSLNLVRGRYYYKATLPGTRQRKTYPLIAPGNTKSTREKRIAIVLANEMWQKAAAMAEDNGEVDCLPSEMTTKKYTDKYIEMRKHDLSEATLLSYKISIRYALYFLGETRMIDTITPLLAQEFKAALAENKLNEAVESKKKLNRVSVNLHMRQVRAVFNFAVTKLKILSTNPFSGMVERVKLSKRWHYVNAGELQACLDAATDDYRCFVALCRLAGLRRMEAYHLEWKDVNFEKGILHIVGKDNEKGKWQPKSRKSRPVPICPELQQILLNEFERAPEQKIRVCSLSYPGNIDRDVKSTIKRAGLSVWEKPLHTLRKSCITDWASKYPIHVVMVWSGHERVETTQEYYLQVTPDQYERAATESFWGVKTTDPQTVGA